jgi:hypothetical protein
MKTILIAGIAGLSFASTASATITIEAGNNPQPGEQNILFNQTLLLGGWESALGATTGEVPCLRSSASCFSE